MDAGCPEVVTAAVGLHELQESLQAAQDSHHRGGAQVGLLWRHLQHVSFVLLDALDGLAGTGGGNCQSRGFRTLCDLL